MGYSFLKFKENGFRMSDSFIELVLHYIVVEIDKYEDKPLWLSELSKWWSFTKTGATSTSVDLKLDAYLTNEDRILCVSIFIENAIASLKRKGEFILPDEYNSFIDTEFKSYITNPIKTSKIIDSLSYLSKLINGKIELTIDDNIFYPDGMNC